MKPREHFVLTLRDDTPNDADATPATNRLKRALKVLLRSFGLRCTHAALHPADDSPAVDLTPDASHLTPAVNPGDDATIPPTRRAE